MTLNMNRPLLANPDIVYRQEPDGAFLFDPRNGDLKCLNPMGSVIWRLCDGSFSINRMQQEISAQYPCIAPETVHAELAAFLQELLDIGYLGYRLDEQPADA